MTACNIATNVRLVRYLTATGGSRGENAVYLVRAPHGSAFPRCWDVCRGIAHDGGAEFVLERTFSERDGVANTFLYSLQPTPVAAPG